MLHKTPCDRSPRPARAAVVSAAAALCLGLALPQAAAQTKVGSNPTSQAADTYLQVEATNGGQVVVRKSTAQVGVGTATPGNRLEVNSGSAGASGMRLTQLKNAALLGTDANGDVVGVSVSSSCTCGDIKTSLNTVNHGGWVLMDGSQGSGTCGAAVWTANLRDKVAVQANNVGSISASNLVQSQLPNVDVSGRSRTWKVSDGGGGTANRLWVSSQSTSSRFFPQDIAVTASLNGGQTQTALTVDNFPRMDINYFVCTNP